MKKTTFTILSVLISSQMAFASTAVTTFTDDLYKGITTYLGKNSSHIKANSSSTQQINDHFSLLNNQLNPLVANLISKDKSFRVKITQDGKKLRATNKSGDPGSFRNNDKLLRMNLVESNSGDTKFYLQLEFSDLSMIRSSDISQELLKHLQVEVDKEVMLFLKALSGRLNTEISQALGYGANLRVSPNFSKTIAKYPNEDSVFIETGVRANIPLIKLSIQDIKKIQDAFNSYKRAYEDSLLELPR